MVIVKDITNEEREIRVKRKGISSLVEKDFSLMKGFLTGSSFEDYCRVYSIFKLKTILDVHFSSPESPRLTLRDEEFYDKVDSLVQKMEQKGAKVLLNLDYSK
jgi:hypothetical protein